MVDNITLFSKQISCYDLFINMGSCIGIIVFIYLCWKNEHSYERTVEAGVLAYALLVLGFFLSNLLVGINTGQTITLSKIFTDNYGAHFIGRVIFAVWLFPVLYILLFQKKDGEWYGYMNVLCFYLIIQHIFNRIACLFNGCCEGREYHGMLAFTYPFGRGYGAGFDYPMYPTQLFEIVSMIFLLVVCIYLYSKNRSIIVIFTMWFSITIFLSEFMMENEDAVYFLGIDAIQYSAIILMLTGIFIKKRVLDKRKYKNV